LRRRANCYTWARIARPSKHAINSLCGFRTRAGDRHAQVVKKQAFSLLDDFAAEVFEVDRMREMNKCSSYGFHVLSIARITTPVRILYDCFRNLALSFFMNYEGWISFALGCRPAIEFYSVLQAASKSAGIAFRITLGDEHPMIRREFCKTLALATSLRKGQACCPRNLQLMFRDLIFPRLRG
jgi:hypothetical protein